MISTDADNAAFDARRLGRPRHDHAGGREHLRRRGRRPRRSGGRFAPGGTGRRPGRHRGARRREPRPRWSTRSANLAPAASAGTSTSGSRLRRPPRPSRADRRGAAGPPASRSGEEAAGVRAAPLAATCSGVPWATTRPPSSPPSGPRSMIRSAVLITSRLCSITTTVLPGSTRRSSISSSRWTSAKWRPVVGSSRM